MVTEHPGPAFRRARQEAGEDMRDCAARFGISVAYFSRLERGLERWPERRLPLVYTPPPVVAGNPEQT